MSAAGLAVRLWRNDVRLIWRDRFLIFMCGFVIVIAATLRWGMPALDVFFAQRGILPNEAMPHRLQHFYPLAIAFMALFNGATITGAVFGFALLDERDNRTMQAVLVTPLPFRRYLGYRVLVPTAIACLVVVGMTLFIGHAPIPLRQLLPIGAGAALTSPLATLFYATVAENKVQGFAYAKFVSISGWVILISWFVADPWQLLFGFFPPYWIARAYWSALAGAPSWWIWLIVGTALHLLALGFQLRWFRRVVYRQT